MPENIPTPAGFRGKDLSGRRFEDVTVLEYVGRVNHPGGSHTHKWKCRCERCGKIFEILQNNLGRCKTCGCLRHDTRHALTHGHSANGKTSKTYKAWSQMKQRCLNPNHEAYSDYGGRGITVCERWMTFPPFLEDMGEAPPGLTLERIDVNLGYFKENCTWATEAEQNRNRRDSVKYTIDGQTKNQSVWCMEFGIKHGTFANRLKRGWSVEKALKTPMEDQTPRTATINGKTQTLHQWADELGIRYGTVLLRIQRGMTFEKALTFPVKRSK